MERVIGIGGVGLLIQPQRVVSPVNAEWRVHHRQEHLQFQASGHAWPPVRGAQDLKVLGWYLAQLTERFSALAVKSSVQCRTSELGTNDLIILHCGDLY